MRSLDDEILINGKLVRYGALAYKDGNRFFDSAQAALEFYSTLDIKVNRVRAVHGEYSKDYYLIGDDPLKGTVVLTNGHQWHRLPDCMNPEKANAKSNHIP